MKEYTAVIKPTKKQGLSVCVFNTAADGIYCEKAALLKFETTHNDMDYVVGICRKYYDDIDFKTHQEVEVL